MYKIVGITVLSVFLLACRNKAKGEQNDAYSVASNKVDLFQYKISPKYATGFSVEYHGNYKVVRTQSKLSSWSGNASESKKDIMVLVQKGTPIPKLTGELERAEVIRIPAERVAVNIENAENFLGELGLTDKMVAIGGLISYNDSIRKSAIEGDLIQVGYSWHQPPMFENLLASKPDLFLMNLSNLDFAESLDKCRQLDIPTGPVFSWSEKSYLAQAEWLKYYALFFNAEEKANAIFNEIEQNVENLKNKVTSLKHKPTAIWGYYTGKDKWLVHRNSTESQFMLDAGLDNIFFQPEAPLKNAGEPMAFEELLSKAKNVEHWIIGDVHSETLPKVGLMNSFISWRLGNLYHNFKRSKPKDNAYDWYGSAIVRPDRVLADLIHLIHPQLLPDHELYYMDRLSKDFQFPIAQEAL
ncbi:ABC transporter substrate-binding protein [Ulvibacterium sp.]|uniref:ABC transporter substrate-binding protein n=1 Tax=Ulvibacterium sp. TaxID=2665914 RepID=UPI003BA89F8A